MKADEYLLFLFFVLAKTESDRVSFICVYVQQLLINRFNGADKCSRRTSMDLNLKGKVAVITGSSTGIGAGTARVLASEGCNVVINYFASKEKAEVVAKDIMGKYGVKAICVGGDMSKEEDIKNLFAETMKEFGTVDILMNNAVNSHDLQFTPFENFDFDYLRRSEAIIIEGAFLCTKEFIRILKSQNKGGHIVNVVSKSMYWSSSIFNEVYASCKGAVSAFTRAIAHEYGMEGIYCNAIIPGYCNNAMVNKDSERYKRTIKLLPLGRYAEPEEMGYTVAFLCSDKALQINGATIDLTGGTLVGDFVDKSKFVM